MANNPPKRASAVISEALRDPKILGQMREVIETSLARGELTQEKYDSMIGVVEGIEREMAEDKGSA
jgi:hypothetical protein